MDNDEVYRAIEPYLTGRATTCSYCDKLDELIIYEGDYFYITNAIGAFVPGCIQLCAKSHRTAATGVESYEIQELVLLKAAIREAFEETYGNSGIAFEHGQAGSCLWGRDAEKNEASLCHHMHIHYIPRRIDIHAEIAELCPQYYEVQSHLDMLEVRNEKLEAEQYLYFEPESNKGYMYSVSGCNIPRQFLRSCVAKALGIPERADWQAYPGVEFYDTTRQALQPRLLQAIREN